jgi:hypothetical protein
MAGSAANPYMDDIIQAIEHAAVRCPETAA